jgi:transposase
LENALQYFGGVPQGIVVDNLKAAVHQASRYEPRVNETFEDFALHYQTSVLPTRAAKPKDKALVEGAVRIVYQRIFAPLRQQVFFELASLNVAIREALLAYNSLHFQGRPYSRQDLFERVEKASLQALPAQRYPMRHYYWARVQKNAHVLLSQDKHYYSVPYRYTGQRVKLVYTASGVEVYDNYERIACHGRDYRPFQYTTQADHLPSTHRFVSEWNPERFKKWAADIGPQTKGFITALLNTKTHPEQGYKASMGVLALASKVGKQRLENACNRALYYQNYSYRTVCNILEKGLDSWPAPDALEECLPEHDNIRGQHYYQ